MKARGFHYGPQTDEKLKTHNALLPFAELPEDLKEANRLNVRDIPDQTGIGRIHHDPGTQQRAALQLPR